MAFDLMRGFRRLSLKGPVGNGLDNDENDVKTVKEELRREALFSPNPRIGMTGIIDRDTMDGITAFQRRQGLKPDGIVTPGGETERALNRRRASRTMAANANQVEADARARGETGFSVLRANTEAREKARQERRRQATEPAADRDGEDAGAPPIPPDDGLRGGPRSGPRNGQPERPAASRSGANQPGAESSAQGGGDRKRTALARLADGHGGASRSKDTDAQGLVSAAAAREALFNLSEADRAELRKLLDLPDDATTEEIQVALGPAIVVIPALFGLGVGASIFAQDKETRDKVAKAASRGLQNARDNLSHLADRTQDFFGSDDDAGEPAAKDRPQHPAFQAIDPGTLEPPRGSDPEEGRNTPSSPPPERPVDMSEIPPLPGFMPEDRDNLVEIFPDQSGELPNPLIVENRQGSPETQDFNADVADLGRKLAKGKTLKTVHKGGARSEEGMDKKETFLPRREGNSDGTIRGSSFLDISFFVKETKRWLHINTVSTRADGKTPNTREDASGNRVIQNKEKWDIFIQIPKPGRNQTFDMAALEEFLSPLFKALCADDGRLFEEPEKFSPTS